MKAIASILALACALAFCGCTTTATSPDQTKFLAQLGVKYAVIKVTEKHPEKAAKILAISRAVRQVAGGEGFNTVDLLMAYIKTKVDYSKLDAADTLLANTLIDVIGAELKSRIGSGVLTSEKLLVVSEVAGWIEDQAAAIQPTK